MLCRSVSSNRKIITVALFLLLIISASFGALFVNLAYGNPGVARAPPPSVTIQLPESEMYNSSKVPVACTVEAAQDWAKWLFQEQRIYILDGKYLYSWPRQLSEGTHRLRIKVHLTYYISFWNIGAVEAIGSSDEVVFTVNAAEPRVSVLEPRPAETYNTPKITLNFSVSEPASWLGYSIDGEAPVTITRNTTLYGLSDGTHTIIIQAEDTTGSTGASKPITFKVETQTVSQPTEPQTIPFPTTWIASSIVASVAAISFGLVAYFRRRKRRSPA